MTEIPRPTPTQQSGWTESLLGGPQRSPGTCGVAPRRACVQGGRQKGLAHITAISQREGACPPKGWSASAQDTQAPRGVWGWPGQGYAVPRTRLRVADLR